MGINKNEAIFIRCILSNMNLNILSHWMLFIN